MNSATGFVKYEIEGYWNVSNIFCIKSFESIIGTCAYLSEVGAGLNIESQSI